MRRTVIGALALWVLASAGFSQESSIRFIGGVGFAAGGDLNETIRGINDLRRDLDSATGELKPLNWGMNFDLEFIHHFTPNIGLGMGIGYFRAVKDSGPSSYEFDIPGIFSMGSAFSIKPVVSAVPVTLNIHYFLPAGRRWSLDFRAGVGYYIVRLNLGAKDVLHDSFFGTINENWTEETTFKATQGGIGVQAGMGLEFIVTPKVAIVLDACGRLASVSGFKGTYAYAESGDYTWQESAADYYFWAFDEKYDGGVYTLYDFYTDQPESEYITNARKGSVDLSGFGISLGLRIKF